METRGVLINQLNDISCLEVSYGDGEKMKYPYVWLRDNCDCSQCRYPDYKNQRKITPVELDLDIDVTKYQLNDSQECVTLTFSDAHESSFTLDWLKKNTFTDDRNEQLKRHGRMTPITWGQEYEGHVYEADYDKVVTSDEALLELISTIEVRGIAVLTGAPKEHGVLEKLCARMGNLNSTLFNPGPACMKFFLDKESQYDLIAYTTKTLHMHTDLAFATSHPVIQYLQAISQPPGVVNLFVDGMKIVEVLRKQHPDALNLLSTVPVEHVGNYTGQYMFRAMSGLPIITLSDKGEFVSINYSSEFRATGIGCKAENVKDFYKAMKTFLQVLKDNTIDKATPEGNIFLLDNNRILHGRAAFTLNASCHRHLEVAYTEMDAMMSTKRLILEKNI